MFRVRFICLVLVLGCLFGAAGSAMAVQVDSDATYCFTAQDFALSEEPLTGICITQLPGESGAVMLGNRVLRPGDILTAAQIEQMTFCSAGTQEDATAQVMYLPIYENRVEPCAGMTINIRGRKDNAPNAQDSTLETYKNIPNQGRLKAQDPEGKALSYTLVRPPKRGDVEIGDDGSFTYTPKKNKVGIDSFTYTVTDPAGNVSREATVTVQILKPSDIRQYTDTVGDDCRFEAEWMRNTGLFVGESVNGQSCFQPERAVSRGEFLAMMVELLDIPVEDAAQMELPEQTPQWLRPYLTAALRSGLTDRLPDMQTLSMDEPISGAEAAVMLQNILDLSVTEQALETSAQMQETEVPAWAAASVTVLQEHGVSLAGIETMSRADAAQVLYQVSRLALDAPGMQVVRMQQ